MNKNIFLSGGGKNLTGGGKWGWRGRELGERGREVGERGREVGNGYPPPPLSDPSVNDARCINQLETANKQRI